MSNLIGIDLGGTKIAAARYAAGTLHLEEQLHEETDAGQGMAHVLLRLNEVIAKLANAETTGIGIGVPGLVNQSSGQVLHLPNIPDGKNVDVAAAVQKEHSLHVTVENDANCFAFAEALVGAGKEHDVVVGITMGTGVGGGIVIHQKLFRGERGYAAEFGHMLLQPGQPPYKSDNMKGEVSQFLSGTAMGKRCDQANHPEEYLEGEVCEFMRPDIFREVAWMCVNLIHALDPGIIIFGGSAGQALKPHLATVQKELEQWILPGTPLPQLHITELTDGATRGAALLAQ